jgi:hypothetical protein
MVAEQEKSIKATLLKICPYYDDIHPVFGDRPLTRPVYHSSTEYVIELNALGGEDESIAENIVESDESDHHDEIQEYNVNQGSPPTKNSSGKKRLKLTNAQKSHTFGEKIAAAMERQTQAQATTASATLAAKQAEIQMLQREKRHNEIMSEARLLMDLGVSRDDIVKYVNEHKRQLEQFDINI